MFGSMHDARYRMHDTRTLFVYASLELSVRVNGAAL